VGGVKDISVSVRIISATNQNLEKRVREGAFREDLFYRLKVVPITVPPLRERREDILPLASHFMQQFNMAFKKDFLRITPEAERTLLEYPWPGNIRELRSAVRQAASDAVAAGRDVVRRAGDRVLGCAIPHCQLLGCHTEPTRAAYRLAHRDARCVSEQAAISQECRVARMAHRRRTLKAGPIPLRPFCAGVRD
jgi:transcriptional regulator with PAS, ATPase and Fis domain